MKTYLKFITAFLVFGLTVANMQAQNSNAQADSTAPFESVEAATKAVVDSVPADDKANTLALLAKACKQFPQSAAAIVTALIDAIGKFNASSQLVTQRNVALGINPGDVNPIVVGEIVATAINAAPSAQASIITAALLVAPNAATQINAAGANPLTFPTGQGLGGNSINPATLPNNNEPSTPVS